jgi:hypothetical protein
MAIHANYLMWAFEPLGYEVNEKHFGDVIHVLYKCKNAIRTKQVLPNDLEINMKK